MDIFLSLSLESRVWDGVGQNREELFKLCSTLGSCSVLELNPVNESRLYIYIYIVQFGECHTLLSSLTFSEGSYIVYFSFTQELKEILFYLCLSLKEMGHF